MKNGSRIVYSLRDIGGKSKLKQGEDNSSSISRDFNSVLHGDSIVLSATLGFMTGGVSVIDDENLKHMDKYENDSIGITGFVWQQNFTRESRDYNILRLLQTSDEGIKEE
ncbi:hypothetical protein EDD18DRAFT_1100261 [Armillaria luteobubalina]|uniref:Uncharacterized protein n=1 Tax=Armillaria luteobubalina TaxID=153913 RepID=A0AA39QKN8_9AGAR|nr:hypothetical protein EDD18DRAFT_1100261 [Armillaria luteobubalina]